MDPRVLEMLQRCRKNVRYRCEDNLCGDLKVNFLTRVPRTISYVLIGFKNIHYGPVCTFDFDNL